MHCVVKITLFGNYIIIVACSADLWLVCRKSRLPDNLYCVGGDVKPCSIQSNPIVANLKEYLHRALVFLFSAGSKSVNVCVSSEVLWARDWERTARPANDIPKAEAWWVTGIAHRYYCRYLFITESYPPHVFSLCKFPLFCQAAAQANKKRKSIVSRVSSLTSK